MEALIGQKFWRWQVLSEPAKRDGTSWVQVQCSCDKKTVKEVRLPQLKCGKPKSCGCLKSEATAERNRKSAVDIPVGSVYGRLTVLSVQTGTKDRQATCRCECGATVAVAVSSIRAGHTKSCGCLRKEMVAEKNTTHGQAGTPLYRVWSSMWDRCTREKSQQYADYGGRGITVDPRWEKFETFLADMGTPPFEGASIDREDNDKGYSPENCRWATRVEQAENTRRNKRYMYKGQLRLIKDVAEETGLAIGYLYYRVNSMGHSLDQAVEDKFKAQQ